MLDGSVYGIGHVFLNQVDLCLFMLFQVAKSEVEEAIERATDLSYRHIDSAYVYLNEEEVGWVIQRRLPMALGRGLTYFTLQRCSVELHIIYGKLTLS